MHPSFAVADDTLSSSTHLVVVLDPSRICSGLDRLRRVRPKLLKLSQKTCRACATAAAGAAEAAGRAVACNLLVTLVKGSAASATRSLSHMRACTRV
eukprot:354984-Chlamydomonas_euryale.AAC.3